MSDAPLLTVDPAWQAEHTGATVGVLAIRGASNPASHDALNAVASALEEGVRARFGETEHSDLRNTPPLPAYAAYYKRWGQRYHVGMQLESVAQKGKPLPRVAALVEAMFIAELRNLLLTGGHDLDQIELPVRIDSGAGETFLSPSGAEMTVKPGDMFIADAQDRVLSAIITGPSDVARIGPQTTALITYVYAPPGVERGAVASHLDEIERNVRLIAPNAEVVGREVLTA
jgi:DNA/RNA-binding domain of Phe-tRNA-synthetase-like protein